jgi:hypothetical protein
MTDARRVLSEVLALGVANGLLMGTALTASHRGPALLMASGVGTFVTLTYLLETRWRQLDIQIFTEPDRGGAIQCKTSQLR